MTNGNDGDSRTSARRSSGVVAAKRPYAKPAFRFEKVFETRALACGKVQPTTFPCIFNRRNS